MTLKEIVELQSIIDKRKIAKDTLNTLENNYYYSKSKKQNIKFADMHIDHFLRALKLHKEDKSKVDIETAELIEQLKKTNEKINKLARQYELEG